MRKFGCLVVLLVLGATLVIFVSAYQSDENLNETAARAMPEDEKAFVNTAAEYGGSKFIDASPLELVPIRRARAHALCAINSTGVVRKWVGRVEEISATNRGDAILRVYLYGSGTVYFENWNEKTSSVIDKLPISQGTPLFNVVAGLKRLQLITFDGELRPSGNDCFRTSGSETSDETGNLAATMMSPTFIFGWKNIQPLH